MIFPIVIASTLHARAPSTDGDRWLAADKVKHFFSAAFVQSVSYGALRAAHASHGGALTGGSGVTAPVSIGKGVWDARGHGTPSARDLVGDAAGAGAASTLLSHTIR